MIIKFPVPHPQRVQLGKKIHDWKATDQLLVEAIQQIAEQQDRPVSYIGRKLLLRGLVAYRRDGRLRNIS
jgi:hypothetical protein